MGKIDSAPLRTLNQAFEAARLAGEAAGKASMSRGGRRIFSQDDETAAADARLAKLHEYGFVTADGDATFRYTLWRRDRHAAFTVDPRELAAVDEAMPHATELSSLNDLLDIEDLDRSQRVRATAQACQMSEDIVAAASRAEMDVDRLLELCLERISAERAQRKALFSTSRKAA